VRAFVGWLEKEHEDGFLSRSYTTATLIIAVSDSIIWTWSFCPHGVAHGSPDEMRFVGTDLRNPQLRRIGVLERLVFDQPGIQAGDKASSIFCIGTPRGYEAIQLKVTPGQAVVALDRGAFPFGRLPSQPIPLTSLWIMDAAWKHGLPGNVVVFGHLRPDDINVPEDWSLHEVQLGTPCRITSQTD